MPILIYSADPTPGGIGGIDANTVLMLHMDGDFGDTGHDVTSNGNPQFSTAQSKFGGSSMYFDGSGDYLTIPTSTDWDFGTDDFTIDFWSKFDNLDNKVVIGRWVQAGGAERWIIQWKEDNSTNRFSLFKDETAYNFNVISMDTNWHHCAFVFQNPNMTFYFDGVVAGTVAVGSFPTGARPFTIGALDEAPGVVPYSGYIDELRISKGIARWTSDFSGSLPSVPYTSDANTKLLLHFDGDVSDSAHVVTVNGDPQLSATTAKFDGSMYFDGNGDYLSIPTSNDFSFGSGDFTVDFWIRFISPTDLITPIIGQMEDGSNRWHFVLNNNTGVNEGLLLFSTYSSGANMIVEAGSWFPNADTWYHIALVRSGGIIKIYVNGESQALSINNNPDESINIDSDLYIGDRGFDEFGNIYVDEFRISKGIARWTSNFTPESGPYTE